MKIAFLNIYQNNTERGSEVFVNELSKRLSEKHSVDVLGGNYASQDRVPLLWRLYLDPNGLAIFFFTMSQVPTLLKNNYDVVIPLNGGWQPALVRIVTWVLRKKMIIVGQSGIGWDDRNNLFCFPDRFVAISTRARTWAGKVLPGVKNVYIPNGVDRNVFNPKGEVYKHGLRKPVFLCVAALVPSKRIDRTIDAVSRIKGSSLIVVGKGPLEKSLTSLGKKVLGERFLLVNAKHSQMPSLYRSADVFTLVSESSEAFGIVYAEALASNLPVVAPNDEQRREIVGDAGVLTGTSEDAYKASLEKSLSLKLKELPRKQSEKFDWDIIAQKYENLISSLSN